jgi:hypothetical protein
MEKEHGPTACMASGSLRAGRLSIPFCFGDMRGQGSTEPDISAGENTERAFVQALYLWFRDSATAWVGTAGELLSELKARGGALDRDGCPEDARAVCSRLESNTELLRSYGLKVHVSQQDNGLRLISIRQLEERAGIEDQESHVQDQESPSNSPIMEDTGADVAGWHNIRTSLTGFDTANTVPTGIAHRMILTGIVILAVVGVLLLIAWNWPGSFPVALFADSTARSRSALISRPGEDQATTTQGPQAQQSDTPRVSHGAFVAANDGAGDKAAMIPEGVPQLLEQSRAGEADAQYLLGRAYEIGAEVEQDLVNAYVWYVIADASGNPGGKDAARQLAARLSPSDIASVRLKLGSIYASGAYVPRDYTKAYVWFSLAASAGDPAGEREKSRLAQKMTEREIAAANNRASDWLKRHEKQVR